MGKQFCSAWEVLCKDHYQQAEKEPAHIPFCLSSPILVHLAEGNPHYIGLKTSPLDQQSQYLFHVQGIIAQCSQRMQGQRPFSEWLCRSTSTDFTLAGQMS